MKNVVTISIIFMLHWLFISCKNEPGSNKTMLPRNPELGECQQAKIRSQEGGRGEIKGNRLLRH